MSLIDFDELTDRLMVIAPDRLAASFAIGHLATQMMCLDVAVDDFDSASTEFSDALEERSQFMASFADVSQAYLAHVERRLAVR